MLASARIALVGLALTACANHVRYVDSTSDERSSETVDRQFVVRGPTSVVAEPALRLELERRETIAWETSRTQLRIEEATPYQGARELYEVPVGLVSVPLSFVFNVTDVLLFGYIPNEIVNGYTFWTFSALNPGLNAENPERVERREVERTTQRIAGERQVQSTPLARFAVAVSLDAGEPQTRVSDAAGRFDLDLLGLLPATLGWPPRRVGIEGKDPKTGESVIAQHYYLERRLSERLMRAAPLLALHGSPEADAEELSRAVYGLDQLGFQKEAAEIQDAVYARWQTSSPERLQEFLVALDRYYATGAAFDAEPALPAAPAAVPSP
jgi:hypothetical protein